MNGKAQTNHCAGIVGEVENRVRTNPIKNILLARRLVLLLSAGILVIALIVVSPRLRADSSASVNHAQNAPHVMMLDGSLARSYNSLGELKGASSIIVLGTIGAQQTETNGHGVPSTISTFHVEQVLWSKGAEPRSVLVRQFGGTATDGAKWVMEEFPVFKSGGRYILCLTPAPQAGQFYSVGAYQGAFTVGANGIVSSYSTSTKVVGVQEHGVPLPRFISNIQAVAAVQTQP